MPSIATSDYKAGGFRLTGWRVLGIFFLFFGSIMSVNMLMVYYALTTHRGEIADHPYEVGLAYNSEIAEAHAQAQRNWAVDVAARRAGDGLVHLDVAIKDADGKPMEGLSVTTKMQAPADMRRDIVTALVEDMPGQYHGQVAAAPGGWTLDLEASRDGKRLFLSKNRLRLE